MDIKKTQVYTGNGKGKTTAALGLAIRAAGAGMKIYIGQFVKNMEYSEMEVLRTIPNIEVDKYGLGCSLIKEISEEDKQAAKKGLETIKGKIASGEFEIVIADEICVALVMNLIEENDVLDVMKVAKRKVELVLTGIGATKDIINQADLVTEMQEVKHYYKDQGVLSRKGIDC